MGGQIRIATAAAAALIAGLLIGVLPTAGAATTAESPIPNPFAPPSASPTPSPSATPSHKPKPAPTKKPLKPATPLSRVQTTAPVFFITVDDGYTRDPRVIDLLKTQHVPISAFLIRDAAKKDPAFFRRLRAAGAVLEDHTLSHPYLTTKTPAVQRAQICNDALYMNQTFGHRPTLFRPPYGKYDAATLRAAAACGFPHLILWNAVEQNGQFSAIGGSLAPGSIVILHFVPSLYDDLQRVLAIGRASGLRPASLEHFLAPKKKA